MAMQKFPRRDENSLKTRLLGEEKWLEAYILFACTNICKAVQINVNHD